ncbi:amino acid adenylation domain-containing protein [Massilia sp. CCM 8695]|uniref:Amino acid adenylation domain-containing protein n=1 Tax=Massilia frigida TaxID=2609281 RepID=A0ABX0NF65_9BURK|nr:non-ribosomal peptide synthetase [Massilia frigida]NHZ80360.1 amino acid adenylation domain-containing protein [Massilia frigida]
METAANIFPLSYSQTRLWFLHLLAPASPFYNLQIDMPLPCAIDEAVWCRVISELVRRHEILRTVFHAVDGEPVQQVLGALTVPVASVDLRDTPSGAREEAARRTAMEDAQRPFDLTRGPLLRPTLIRLADDASLFVLTMHHIVTDGWSMDIITGEIAALYEAFVQGQASPLPELPIQYADFAAWQRQSQTLEALGAQLGYWREQLDGYQDLQLPTDFARPPTPSYRGAFQCATTALPVVDGLRRIAQREGATLFMALLAAFQVLMMRYCGQDDIVVGTPIANRNRPEVEPLIGFFVNTLVMRARLAGRPSFREHLRQVRETALGAYANQDLPFEKLVENLHPQRDPSRNPLFQVMFVLQNGAAQRGGPAQAPSYQPGPAACSGVSYGNAKFDLTLYLGEDENGISAIVEYSTDLFADDTIARLIGHWQTLLQSIASSPDVPITRLPLLSPRERALLLTDCNSTGTVYPRDATLGQLFRQQALAAPDAVALNGEDGTLTYGELARRTARLARWLRQQGVQRGDVVGICLPRGIDMVATLVAIVEAGAANLPLDPAYPPARLDAMIGQASPRLIVSRSGAAAAVGRHRPALLDAIDLPADDSAPDSGADADALAYVLFTSGSTGQPKGVCVSHRNVVRLVRNSNYCTITQGDVMLQFAPLQFDASTFEIWGALLNGARLEIAPPGLPSLEELGACIERAGVTILWLTASLFHQMVEAQLGSLWRVRQLLAGGDVLSPALCRRVLDELPGCVLINGYGPTETTTFAACHRMERGAALEPRVPIGRAIANTELYVLDQEMQLAPAGVVGELYIGGDGVARGYLGDPELTAQRFIPNPFASPNSGQRLYRTGDQVRYRADGALEFIGRRDHQVKLRGFRIELGDIEAVMRRHPLVRDACVIASGDSGGADRRLLGYAVLDRAHDIQALRRFLQQELPEYMVPATLIPLDAFPLTPSGKIDRKALPPDEGGEWLAHAPFAEPQSEIERLIAAVWREVLAHERVGLDDNFFDLGGHSLLLQQIHSRLAGLLGHSLSMVDLFRFPTVAALARHVEQTGEHGGADMPDSIDLLDQRIAQQRSARAERRHRRST